MMGEVSRIAAGVGGLLLVAMLVGRLGPRVLRRQAPMFLSLVAIASLGWVGSSAFALPDVLPSRSLVLLASCALHTLCVSAWVPLGPTPLHAVSGGVFLGGVPTVARIARTGRLTPRLLLIATTAGALSPVANLPLLLLLDGSWQYSAWAFSPLLLIVVATRILPLTRGAHPLPTRWILAGTTSIVAIWATGPLLGASVGLLTLGIAHRSDRLSSPPPASGRPGILPWALAALCTAWAFRVSGGAYFTALALQELPPVIADGPLVPTVAALVAWTTHPWVAALLADQVFELTPHPSTANQLGVVLVIGLAGHGFSARRPGPSAALPIATGAFWWWLAGPT